jgi:hypothetical protein
MRSSAPAPRVDCRMTWRTMGTAAVKGSVLEDGDQGRPHQCAGGTRNRRQRCVHVQIGGEDAPGVRWDRGVIVRSLDGFGNLTLRSCWKRGPTPPLLVLDPRDFGPRELKHLFATEEGHSGLALSPISRQDALLRELHPVAIARARLSEPFRRCGRRGHLG